MASTPATTAVHSKKQHDVRGRRRVDGKPARVSDRENANQKRREDFSSRRSFLLGVGLRLLLHTNREHDAWASRQVDAERVGIARGQIAGGHVEVPLPTGKGEGNVRNSRSRLLRSRFQSCPALLPSWLTDRLGDNCETPHTDWRSAAICVAHGELHRDRASTLSLVNAAAVRR